MENPPYFSARDYVEEGIRAHHDMDFCMCTRTSLMWHNETLNCWTHFGGALYWVCQLVMLFFPDDIESDYSVIKTQTSLNTLRLVCILLLWGMLFSAAYHNYSCISKKTTEIFLRVDMIGISV